MANIDEFYKNIPTGQNVALGMPASQFPGTYGISYAEHAVDGHSVVGEHSCAHTSAGSLDNPAWWMVDLEDSYKLLGIKIYNRDRSINTKILSCSILNLLFVKLI